MTGLTRSPPASVGESAKLGGRPGQGVDPRAGWTINHLQQGNSSRSSHITLIWVTLSNYGRSFGVGFARSCASLGTCLWDSGCIVTGFSGEFEHPLPPFYPVLSLLSMSALLLPSPTHVLLSLSESLFLATLHLYPPSLLPSCPIPSTPSDLFARRGGRHVLPTGLRSGGSLVGACPGQFLISLSIWINTRDSAHTNCEGVNTDLLDSRYQSGAVYCRGGHFFKAGGETCRYESKCWPAATTLWIFRHSSGLAAIDPPFADQDGLCDGSIVLR